MIIILAEIFYLALNSILLTRIVCALVEFCEFVMRLSREDAVRASKHDRHSADRKPVADHALLTPGMNDRLKSCAKTNEKTIYKKAYWEKTKINKKLSGS
jgi:hypothetical protein